MYLYVWLYCRVGILSYFGPYSRKKAEIEVLFSVIEKLKSDAAEENEGRRTEIEELTNGKLLIIHVSFSM